MTSTAPRDDRRALPAVCWPSATRVCKAGRNSESQRPLPRRVRRRPRAVAAPTCWPRPPSGTAASCRPVPSPTPRPARCSSRHSPRCPPTTAAPGPSFSADWPSGVTSTGPGPSADSSPTRRSTWPVGSGTARPSPRSCDTATGRWTGPTTSTARSPWPSRCGSWARSTGDSEVLLQGLKCELHARFELGDYEASRRVATRSRTSSPTRSSSPSTCAWGTCGTAWWPGTEGRYADAERNAAEAAAILERTEHPQLYALYVGLSLPWRWLQGRMEDLRLLLEIGKTGRASPGETALVAWVASEIGERSQAEEQLARFGPRCRRRERPQLPLVVPHGGAGPDGGEPRGPHLGRRALRPHRAVRRPQLSGRPGHLLGQPPRCSWGCSPICSDAPTSP